LGTVHCTPMMANTEVKREAIVMMYLRNAMVNDLEQRVLSFYISNIMAVGEEDSQKVLLRM
jgi:hypothetical protein